MRNKLDAVRLALSTVTPQTPRRELDRIISRLARDCTGDELANLVADALDAEAQARKELAFGEARLSALTKARTTRQINARAAH